MDPIPSWFLKVCQFPTALASQPPKYQDSVFHSHWFDLSVFFFFKLCYIVDTHYYMFQVYNIIHTFKRLYSIYSYYKILAILSMTCVLISTNLTLKRLTELL